MVEGFSFMGTKSIKVEVAYAKPQQQVLVNVVILEGETAQIAILNSGILQQFPEIDLTKNDIGIFSQPCKLSQRLLQGDRVEIYRPLLIDPKERRRLRANKSK